MYLKKGNIIKLRRSVHILILIFIVTFLQACGNSNESFGPEEWNQYRLSEDKNAVFENGSEPLETTIFETANEVRSTPVVAKDSLYVGNHDSGDLFAFDIHTGEELWKNQAPNWIHSEMIYQNGKVYVGYGNRYFQDDGIRGTGDSGVLALDAETGEVVWDYETEGEVMPTPVYYQDSIYIATGDKHLYKLDEDSGELLHKEEIGSTVSMSSPNQTGDMLYFGGSGPLPYTFYAYDLANDEFTWETEFDDVIAGLDDVPPAVSDDIVVTTAVEESGDANEPSEHFMYALDTKSGDVIWKESFGIGERGKNNRSGAPMIYEDVVYVGSPTTDTFYAYELETGEKLWEYEDEKMKAPPVAKDDVVYFSNVKGFVHALDAETGEHLDKKELGGTLAPSGPIIINDTLIIGSQDSNVYAVPLDEFETS